MYEDWDALFERWAIMTTDGGLTDYEAYYMLKDLTSPGLFVKLGQWIASH